MAGKNSAGIGKKFNQAINNSQAKAFCEGRAYRASGTSVGRPETDNPFEVNSPDWAAWGNGWNEIHMQAGAPIAIEDQKSGCCADFGNQTILA